MQNAYSSKLENTRLDNVKSIGTEGCYLFSPNIGQFGKYVSHDYRPNQKLNDDFIWTTYQDQLVYIKPWKTDNIISTNKNKPKNEITISIKLNSQDYYLSNNIDKNNTKPKWEKRKNENTKWILETNTEKLEFDINNIDNKDINQIEKNVKKNYFIYKNDKITISIGDRVPIVLYNKVNSRKVERTWTGVYDAIYYAEQVGFKGGRDYAWIKKENNKPVFYNDNYNEEINNNLTEGWYIQSLNTTVNNLYLEYNKINYMIKNKDSNYKLPSVMWSSRQSYYKGKISIDKCSYTAPKPLYIYFKKPDTVTYLSSNKENVIELVTNNNKNIYSCSWHIIMKNNPGTRPLFLENYDYNINTNSRKIYNYLEDISNTTAFNIYSNYNSKKQYIVLEKTLTPNTIHMLLNNSTRSNFTKENLEIIEVDITNNISIFDINIKSNQGFTFSNNITEHIEDSKIHRKIVFNSNLNNKNNIKNNITKENEENIYKNISNTVLEKINDTKYQSIDPSKNIVIERKMFAGPNSHIEQVGWHLKKNDKSLFYANNSDTLPNVYSLTNLYDVSIKSHRNFYLTHQNKQLTVNSTEKKWDIINVPNKGIKPYNYAILENSNPQEFGINKDGEKVSSIDSSDYRRITPTIYNRYFISNKDNRQLEDRKGDVSNHQDFGDWQRWIFSKNISEYFGQKVTLQKTYQDLEYVTSNNNLIRVYYINNKGYLFQNKSTDKFLSIKPFLNTNVVRWDNNVLDISDAQKDAKFIFQVELVK